MAPAHKERQGGGLALSHDVVTRVRSYITAAAILVVAYLAPHAKGPNPNLSLGGRVSASGVCSAPAEELPAYFPAGRNVHLAQAYDTNPPTAASTETSDVPVNGLRKAVVMRVECSTFEAAAEWAKGRNSEYQRRFIAP